MSLTNEQTAKVIEVLGPKIVQPCPSCAQLGTRVLQPEIFVFSSYVPKPANPYLMPPVSRYATDALGGLDVLGKIQLPMAPLIPAIPLVLPCVVTVCKNCGLVEYYNIHALSLAEALGIPPVGSPLP